MVSQDRLTEEPTKSNNDEEIRIEEWSQDSRSITQNSDRSDEDIVCDSEIGLQVAPPSDCCGTFGNIVVKNSTEVQFGNNTYYQGPITIKQFVYKGLQDNKQLSVEDGGFDNQSCLPEFVIDNAQNCDISDNKNNFDKNGNIGNNTTKSIKGGKWDYLYKKRSFYAIFLSVLLVVSIILLTTVLVRKFQYGSVFNGVSDSNEEDNVNVPIDPPLDPDVNVTLSGKLKIIPRLEWLAQPPEDTKPLRHPAPFVVIFHTETASCLDQATCTYHIRTLQTYHIESKNWWDIAYNFLVGGDGFAYEGRGWSDQGADLSGYENRSIGIAFIGTFKKITPPKRQILACQQLIELGVEKGYIAKDYKLFAHRKLVSSQVSEEGLYENLKTWPHWTESPLT